MPIYQRNGIKLKFDHEPDDDELDEAFEYESRQTPETDRPDEGILAGGWKNVKNVVGGVLSAIPQMGGMVLSEAMNPRGAAGDPIRAIANVLAGPVREGLVEQSVPYMERALAPDAGPSEIAAATLSTIPGATGPMAAVEQYPYQPREAIGSLASSAAMVLAGQQAPRVLAAAAPVARSSVRPVGRALERSGRMRLAENVANPLTAKEIRQDMWMRSPVAFMSGMVDPTLGAIASTAIGGGEIAKMLGRSRRLASGQMRLGQALAGDLPVTPAMMENAISQADEAINPALITGEVIEDIPDASAIDLTELEPPVIKTPEELWAKSQVPDKPVGLQDLSEPVRGELPVIAGREGKRIPFEDQNRVSRPPKRHTGEEDEIINLDDDEVEIDLTEPDIVATKKGELIDRSKQPEKPAPKPFNPDEPSLTFADFEVGDAIETTGGKRGKLLGIENEGRTAVVELDSGQRIKMARKAIKKVEGEGRGPKETNRAEAQASKIPLEEGEVRLDSSDRNGFIKLRPDGDYLEVTDIWVAPEARRQGIASSLYEDALKKAKEEGKQGIISRKDHRNAHSDKRWNKLLEEGLAEDIDGKGTYVLKTLEKKAPETDLEKAAREAAESVEDIEDIEDGTTLNASGESAASAEALSRQASMTAKKEKYVVYDRAGNKRPLIGPDAVDYVAKKGETYGIEGPEGFRTLDNKGGKVPESIDEPVGDVDPFTKEPIRGHTRTGRPKVEPQYPPAQERLRVHRKSGEPTPRSELLNDRMTGQSPRKLGLNDRTIQKAKVAWQLPNSAPDHIIVNIDELLSASNRTKPDAKKLIQARNFLASKKKSGVFTPEAKLKGKKIDLDGLHRILAAKELGEISVPIRASQEVLDLLDSLKIRYRDLK